MLGVTQILGLASEVKQIFAFLDTNMLVSPTRNPGVGGLDQRKAPTRNVCVAVEYRLKVLKSVLSLRTPWTMYTRFDRWGLGHKFTSFTISFFFFLVSFIYTGKKIQIGLWPVSVVLQF